MNQALLTGIIENEPKNYRNGVMRFNLSFMASGERTDIRCMLFNNLATRYIDQLKQGQTIFVRGSLQRDKMKDEETGFYKTTNSFTVIVNEIEIIDTAVKVLPPTETELSTPKEKGVDLKDIPIVEMKDDDLPF